MHDFLKCPSQFVQFYERGIGTALAKNDHLSDKELENLKGNAFVPPSEHDTFGLAKNRHVFTIQVESLQEFVINKSINGQEITPNLNRLLKDSAYCIPSGLFPSYLLLSIFIVLLRISISCLSLRFSCWIAVISS